MTIILKNNSTIDPKVLPKNKYNHLLFTSFLYNKKVLILINVNTHFIIFLIRSLITVIIPYIFFEIKSHFTSSLYLKRKILVIINYQDPPPPPPEPPPDEPPPEDPPLEDPPEELDGLDVMAP